MIKLCKYLYIHFTTILLFVVCFLTRKLEILAVSYSAIFIHELAHLVAALLIGLRPSHIIFFPFGVNLKLKNTIVYSITDEIILYFAGPFLNILMALLAISYLKNGNILFRIFYLNNISLFVFNLLPILPMDGGIIAKKILSRRVGSRCAEKILKLVSGIFIMLLLLSEIYISMHHQFNFTVLFAMIFLTGNIFTNKEKYHIDFTKELMYYTNKDNHKIKKVKTYLIKNNINYRKLAENFDQGHYYIVFRENDIGKIEEILTEREIIEEILK